jgi:hypothetical protein
MPDIDCTKLPPFHSTEDILAHPRFALARDAHVGAILALYQQKSSLSRLLIEAAHTVLFNVIICLHACYDAADRATWPTLGLVAESMARHRLGSAAASKTSCRGSSGPAISNSARRHRMVASAS